MSQGLQPQEGEGEKEQEMEKGYQKKVEEFKAGLKNHHQIAVEGVECLLVTG